MKDFVTKATFGFAMAQLFPGAVGAFAVGFMYFVVETPQPNSLLAAARNVLASWSDTSLARGLFLSGFCIGVGMFIHGLNWAVLGAMESKLKGAVFNSSFHARVIATQVISGPARVIFEVWCLLFMTRHVRDARMDENVVRIAPSFTPHHEFLQDFYLYSAQFFAHTTYSFLAALVAQGLFVSGYGYTWRRGVMLALTYVMSGLFFVIGRIQFASLFNAEMALVERTRREWLLPQGSITS